MGDIVISNLVRDFIINIINIIILFVIVKALVYKPVRKFLSARQERIEQRIDESENKLKQAQTLEADYQHKLEESHIKSAEIISEAQITAKQNAAQITETAKANAKNLAEKSRQELAAERQHMLHAAEDEITALAFEISRRILGRECSEEDNAKIAADFFSEHNEKAAALLEKSAKRASDTFDDQKE